MRPFAVLKVRARPASFDYAANDAAPLRMLVWATKQESAVYSRSQYNDLAVVSRVLRQAQVAVAGGINAKTIARFTPLNPAIIVVGAGIMQASNKRDATLRIREAMGWSGLPS